jgi:SAM-dependent methyltransferase
MEQINYQHIEIEEKPFADRLALFMRDVIRPNTVLDIGCGPGHFVYSMRDLGVNAFGIDIDIRVSGKPHLFQQDILSTKFVTDVAICLEVLEHISEDDAEEIIDKISTMFTDTLIFTAAQPGQGGVGHINCQPREYWDKLFNQNNLHRNILMEETLRLYCKQGRYMGWFYNNLLVYTK